MNQLNNITTQDIKVYLKSKTVAFIKPIATNLGIKQIYKLNKQQLIDAVYDMVYEQRQQIPQKQNILEQIPTIEAETGTIDDVVYETETETEFKQTYSEEIVNMVNRFTPEIQQLIYTYVQNNGFNNYMSYNQVIGMYNYFYNQVQNNNKLYINAFTTNSQFDFNHNNKYIYVYEDNNMKLKQYNPT